jgi:hypothetical protein
MDTPLDIAIKDSEQAVFKARKALNIATDELRDCEQHLKGLYAEREKLWQRHNENKIL